MKWTWLPAAGVGVVSLAAQGVQYHTVESAQKQLFPQAQAFRALPLLLTEAQRARIEQAAGVRVRDAHVRLWEAVADDKRQGWLMVDEVLGKHELITYAVALDAQGSILGVEIMDYRETYGGQVKDARWREQFKGKTARDPLKVDADIRNISGATLSSQHVTDGIKRLLVTWQTISPSAQR